MSLKSSVPEHVIERAIGANISARAWRLLNVLGIYINAKTGEGWPSLDTLSDRTKIGRSDLPRVIKELVTAQVVVKTKGCHKGKRGQSCTTYHWVPSEGVCSQADGSEADSLNADGLSTPAGVCGTADQTTIEQQLPSTATLSRERARKAKHKSAISSDWEPSAEEFEYALRKGLTPDDVGRESERFRDHHLKNGSRFADWSAAWRTWVQRVPVFGRGRSAIGSVAAAVATLSRRERAAADTRRSLQRMAEDAGITGAGGPMVDGDYRVVLDEAA